MTKKIKHSVTPHRISSFAAFVAYVEKLQSSRSSRLWFRGVGSIRYALICSLYRHPTRKKATELQKTERDLLVAFEERSLPFMQSEMRDEWNKLFFMQHQGIPTRLLDWTENPFVSLFFAVESAQSQRGSRGAYKQDCGVWVLSPDTWNKAVFGEKFDEGILSTSSERLGGYKPRRIQEELARHAVAISGIHNSSRIVSQRGKFTIFGRDAVGMDTMLSEFEATSDPAPLMRIDIDKAAIDNIRRSLFNYGITESVIYPDLEGLSRELCREFGFSR